MILRFKRKYCSYSKKLLRNFTTCILQSYWNKKILNLEDLLIPQTQNTHICQSLHSSTETNPTMLYSSFDFIKPKSLKITLPDGDIIHTCTSSQLTDNVTHTFSHLQLSVASIICFLKQFQHDLYRFLIHVMSPESVAISNLQQQNKKASQYLLQHSLLACHVVKFIVNLSFLSF